jgi:DNA polymerase-3 subunit gamma/tau
MTYLETARKWRPQTFEQVVAQDHISRTLKNSLKAGRIAHAYLFSGPRGVGKTTMARLLAKALCCSSGPTPDPCGKCENCNEIRLGNFFDVFEIDGASNRGIDSIRELRENVNFAPIKAKYKIYIIDEVHMLTKEAFNALLKTLEEPPPHIVFIFATTESHQIPETILSRCQKFFFKKIPIASLALHLKNIADHDKFIISEKALYSISRSSDGSMRDAQSLFDQVISFASSEKTEDIIEISVDHVLAVLGIVSIDSYAGMLKSIAENNPFEVIKLIDKLIALGMDVPRYISGLLDIIRTLRIIKFEIDVDNIIQLSKEEIEILSNITGMFSDDELAALFKVLAMTQESLRYATNNRIYLEMAMLDMISIMNLPSISSILSKLDNDNFSKTANLDQAKAESLHVTSKKIELKNDSKDSWNTLIGRLEKEKQYLFLVLKQAEISFKDEEIKISFPNKSENPYYSKIIDEKNLKYITAEICKISGKSIKITLESSKATGEMVQDVVADDDSGKVPPPIERMANGNESIIHEKSDPVVDMLKNTFHGEVINHKEK